MTPRERLLAAYRCEEPSELPIMMRGVRSWDEQWVAAQHLSYRPVIEAVAEHGDYQLGWSPDKGILLSTTDQAHWTSETVPGDEWNEIISTLHTPAGPLVSRHKESNRGLPGLTVEHPVKSLEDVQRVLSIPCEPPEPDCASFFALQEQIGERGVVMCAISSPMMMLATLLGSELLAIWSIEQRHTVTDLLHTFAARICDLVDRLLAAGVGPVFSMLGEEFVTPPLHSARDFRQFCVEPEQPITHRVHDAGGIVHTHCHGPLDAVLEDFIELGSDVLHPIEAPPMGNVTMEEAKRRLSGRVCIEGNIQIGDIYAAPTEQIIAQVRHNIQVAAPGGGYVLAPTASPHTDVLTERTVQNYLALIETAVRHGR